MENADDRFFLAWPAALEAGTAAVGGKAWNLARLVRYENLNVISLDNPIGW